MRRKPDRAAAMCLTLAEEYERMAENERGHSFNSIRKYADAIQTEALTGHLRAIQLSVALN
jgi:hypothetical protein